VSPTDCNRSVTSVKKALAPSRLVVGALVASMITSTPSRAPASPVPVRASTPDFRLTITTW
jgi:hypothetical protein